MGRQPLSLNKEKATHKQTSKNYHLLSKDTGQRQAGRGTGAPKKATGRARRLDREAWIGVGRGCVSWRKVLLTPEARASWGVRPVQSTAGYFSPPTGVCFGEIGLPRAPDGPPRALQGARLGAQHLGERCRVLRLGLGLGTLRTGTQGCVPGRRQGVCRPPAQPGAEASQPGEPPPLPPRAA